MDIDIKAPIVVENSRCGIYLLTLVKKKNGKNYWSSPFQYLFEVTVEQNHNAIKELLDEYGRVLLINRHIYFRSEAVKFSKKHLKNGIHKVTPVNL